MRYRDLKNRIGNRAKEIIAGELLLKKKSSYYSCPVTNHQHDNCACLWYPNGYMFYCHDCGQHYDIIDHAKTKSEPAKYLHELAGEEFQEKKFRKIKAASNKVTKSGIEYLQSRGISTETIEAYKITSNDKSIFFNYATPGPEKMLVKVKQRFTAEKRFLAVPGGNEIIYGLHLYRNQTKLVLCEGEIDALSMYEIVKLAGLEDEFLCSSVPNGSRSMTEKLVDDCRQWLDMFELIIIVSDNDTAGQEYKEIATELLGEYELAEICVPKGVKDVNEFYQSADHNPCELLDIKTIQPVLKFAVPSNNIGQAAIINGFKSGYITHDYNDNGLKPGCLTIITGKRGEGKTTYARQFLITAAKEKHNSFMFIGETTKEKEKMKLARLCAAPGELSIHYGIAGRKIYIPATPAIERYNSTFSKYIYLTDSEKFRKKKVKIFPNLLAEMWKMVRGYNVKLFIFDNLMVMCEAGEKALLKEQKDIVLGLKNFAEFTNSHVVLLAHPKKGPGDQSVSGAGEIENICDTILRYIRLDEETIKKLIKKYPEKEHLIERASARIRTEKIRDEGHKKISWIEWDEKRGALYDISDLEAAELYESKGYWTKFAGESKNYSQPYKD